MKKRVEIKNKYDKNLSLIIEMPKEDVKDFLIISHCFTCSKMYKLYSHISEILSQRDYGVVRYDAMGLGQSGGKFSNSSFSTNVEDLLSVYKYVSKEYKKAGFLFGHSLGSLVSIQASNLLDSIKGVITIGSPLNFNNLIRLFSNYEDELSEKDKTVINLAGRNIEIGLPYLEDARDKDIEIIINDFNKPILMFHSDIDKTVPYRDGLELFSNITSSKSFITLRGVTHLAGERKDASYISEIIYNWMESFDRKQDSFMEDFNY